MILIVLSVSSLLYFSCPISYTVYVSRLVSECHYVSRGGNFISIAGEGGNWKSLTSVNLMFFQPFLGYLLRSRLIR